MERGLRIAAFAALLTLVLAACGSRVEPLSFDGGSLSGQPGVTPTGGATVDPVTGETLLPGAGGTTGPGATGGPVAGPLAACRGGATDVGVTASEIRVGLVAAKNGPLPGQFDSNIQAVDAYLKMINADEGGVCGRTFKLYIRDDRGDNRTDEQFARELAEEVKVFSFVGSISAPDSDLGVAKVSRENKIPDIGFPLSYDRTESPFSFGVPGQLDRRTTGEGCSGCRYLNNLYGIKQIAFFWLGEALVSKANAYAIEAAILKASNNQIKICYEQETTVFDSSWDSYATKMNGACPPSGGPLSVWTTMENASNIKLAEAMADQNVQYKFFAPTFTSYLRSFVREADGSPRKATEGAFLAMPQIPFERCASADSKGRPVPPCSHPELDRYVRALRRFVPSFVAPGSFGAPGWGQAALFVAAVKACGANLTRACIMNQLKTMSPFSANGLLSPTRPSERRIYHADLIVQVRNGKFVEIRPDDKSGPSGAPDFWNKSNLFDWWDYFCANQQHFPSRNDVAEFVQSC